MSDEKPYCFDRELMEKTAELFHQLIKEHPAEKIKTKRIDFKPGDKVVFRREEK